jgi:hypothetical protein
MLEVLLIGNFAVRVGLRAWIVELRVVSFIFLLVQVMALIELQIAWNYLVLVPPMLQLPMSIRQMVGIWPMRSFFP